MAGGLHISDIPSKRPSLANTILCAANPEETPIVTRVRKGKTITQMDHTYYVEEKPTRNTEGTPDGKDASEFEGAGKRHPVQCRAMEFRRFPKVGHQTQMVMEDTTTTDQFARLKLVLSKEQLKDAETKILSDDSSRPDDGMKGSEFGGLGERLQIAGAAQSDQPIPTEVRIPAAQVYSGAISGFTEEKLKDMMEARRNATGVSAELAMFLGTKLQRKFDDFAEYSADRAGHTAITRTLTNAVVKKTIERGVRFYEGTFGTVELVINDFLPDQYRGYLLDMQQQSNAVGESSGLEMMPFGAMSRFHELPNQGGGPRGILYSILAFKVGDPRAHMVIKATA